MSQCNCETKKQVFRVFRNGVKHFGEQCQLCGSFFSKKKSEINEEVLPAFDETIKKQYYDNINRHWEQKREEHQNKLQQQRAIRRLEYESYIESEIWKKRRQVILERDRWICQGCLHRKAVDVHHLTYDRLGDELAFDLISLCRQCHDKAHGKLQVNLSGILNQSN